MKNRIREILQGFALMASLRHLTKTDVAEAQDQILKTLNDESKKYLDSLEIAWTIIANVSGGDWNKQTDEWKKAAENWRDNHYHEHLSDIQSLLEGKK